MKLAPTCWSISCQFLQLDIKRWRVKERSLACCGCRISISLRFFTRLKVSSKRKMKMWITKLEYLSRVFCRWELLSRQRSNREWKLTLDHFALLLSLSLSLSFNPRASPVLSFLLLQTNFYVTPSYLCLAFCFLLSAFCFLISTLCSRSRSHSFPPPVWYCSLDQIGIWTLPAVQINDLAGARLPSWN